jgi:hypothetical protein
MAALEPRVARAEGEEAAAPKAPLRLVAALEERMEGLAGRQVGRRQRAGEIGEGWVRPRYDSR